MLHGHIVEIRNVSDSACIDMMQLYRASSTTAGQSPKSNTLQRVLPLESLGHTLILNLTGNLVVMDCYRAVLTGTKHLY